MSAHALVIELAEIGVEIWAEGPHLYIEPVDSVPDALLDRIRAGKAELLACLREPDQKSGVEQIPPPAEVFRNRLLDLCETLDDEALVRRLSHQDLIDASGFWTEDIQLRAYVALQRYEPEPTADELAHAQDAHTRRWCAGGTKEVLVQRIAQAGTKGQARDKAAKAAS